MTMDQMLYNLGEKSVIAGAFVYLLVYFVGQNSKILGDIADTLKDISNTLANIDKRVEKLERRVNQMEGVKNDD